ncbi:ABC transporter ATP-binding protein [Propionibacterium freudenreichii]|uniref:ABC transporter ATP-binding protein n=1 Tax=Propionibacterium freudenreichii TaxID=1744 RepID=UPI0022FDA7A5|nr:ABC transporter ATP-binding protein [Propionibacterium freudenreichii]
MSSEPATPDNSTTARQSTDARGSASTAAGSSETSGVEIVFNDVVKSYPGQDIPAVDHLSLTIPAGEIVTFVGLSGSGKTTSLKMINRLIEPTSGAITIGGRDTRDLNPDKLRTQIGYVIQGGSLFPHMTVADNIAVVPRLLNWKKGRINKRIDELLKLVGLDPAEYRERYPKELSGGQQQRVGVARGLAADPPVLLMDEPFGAVDPITRARLQDELLAVQATLRKTMVIVTHDIDEAIKLGDRILVMKDHGHIAQYDTAERILANPADEFVADFVGRDSALKQLSLQTLASIQLEQAATVHAGDPVHAALREARHQKRDQVVVLDDNDRPVDWLWTTNLRGKVVHARPGRQPILLTRDVTLDTVLDTLVTSMHEGAVVIDDAGHLLGIATFDQITQHVRDINARAAKTRAEKERVAEETDARAEAAEKVAAAQAGHGEPEEASK